MESKEMIKPEKLTQQVKPMGHDMDESEADHVIFWIDLKELPCDDANQQAMQLRVNACADVTADDEMGRRLRAALKATFAYVIADWPEDPEMEQKQEADVLN